MRTTPGPALLSFGLLFLLFAPAAFGEEWYDAYSSGIKAFERHETEKAILSLERAIRLRPEPGTNVITYGTNWLDEYAPYLYLAEAYLVAGKPEKAREALRRSERFSKEAADRRAHLAADVEAAMGPHPTQTGNPPTLASSAELGADVEVLLLLARSHLLEAQAALAAAARRDRDLAPLVEPLAPRLADAIRALEKAMAPSPLPVR